MDFRNYVRTKVLKPDNRILEFGPLTRPIVSKETHPKIFYADVRSTSDIRKLYTSNDYLESTGIKVDLDSIVDIDYVIKASYKSSFKGVEKFDTVIASHVLEHIPDIIFFFQDVASILKSSSRLVLIYPDARYCFDHFRNGTTFVDAYEVYKGIKNSSSRVFDFVNNVVNENDPYFYWKNSKQNNILPKNDFRNTITAFKKADNNTLPDDTHFWPFSDYQFIRFLYDMDRAGLLNFDIDSFYPTQENTQEFMIILKPKNNKTINYNKYIKMLNITDPAVKSIKNREQITKLQEQLEELEVLRAEGERIKHELSIIYNSKRWAFANKLANIKSKISIKNVKK